MDFSLQPVADYDELIRTFGYKRLRAGSKIVDTVDAVEVHRVNQTYEGTCQGEHVVYDGVKLPGVSTCTCNSGPKNHYCDHIAAVGLYVLGKGGLPEEIAESSAPVGFREKSAQFLERASADELRAIIFTALNTHSSIEYVLFGMLEEGGEDEEIIEKESSTEDATAIAPDLFESLDDLLRALDNEIRSVADFKEKVDHLISAAGRPIESWYGPEVAGRLMKALEICQHRIHDFPPEDERASLFRDVNGRHEDVGHLPKTQGESPGYRCELRIR